MCDKEEKHTAKRPLAPCGSDEHKEPAEHHPAPAQSGPEEPYPNAAAAPGQTRPSSPASEEDAAAQERSRLTFRKGLRDGLPICLGYLSVAFTFGMLVAQGGFPPWVAVLISMTCFTGTGQFAGIALIVSGGMYLEMLVTTFVINVRYLLMSLSLSQKIEKRMSGLQRALLSFGNTDEIFAVAMQQEGKVGARYLSGLILTPYLGWTLGTLLGATVTGFLPLALRSALGIAIYGMFISIIIPPARKLKSVAVVLLIAVAISCLFYWTPVLNRLSNGWVVIICAVTASAFGAWKFPVKEDRQP